MADQNLLQLPSGTPTGSTVLYGVDPSLPVGSQDIQIPSNLVGGNTLVNLGSCTGSTTLDLNAGKAFSLVATGSVYLEFDNPTDFEVVHLHTYSDPSVPVTLPNSGSMIAGSSEIRYTRLGGTWYRETFRLTPYGNWNYSAWTYQDQLSLTAAGNTALGIAFSHDGAHFYTLHYNVGAVLYQYDTATPWMLSGATYVGSYSSGLPTTAYDCRWVNDGDRVFILNVTNTRIDQHNASTPYLVSTLSIDANSLDVSGQIADLEAFGVSDDYTRLLVVDATGNGTLHSYTMSTPGDLDTATYDSLTLSLSDMTGIGYGVGLSPDGRTLVIGDTEDVWYWTLSTPNDISTGTYAGKLETNLAEARGFFAQPGGEYFYTQDYIDASTPGLIRRYTLP